MTAPPIPTDLRFTVELEGRFEVGDCLARGAISVFEATDLQLGRPVVLKISAGESQDDGFLAERLFEEARIAARVDHPRVARVFDYGRRDDFAYLVLERLRGEPLEAQTPFTISRALTVAREVAEILAAVHAKGIVHCDLSPSNVLWTEEDRAALVDFGLGRRLDDASRPGAIAGTPGFLAPEQILRRKLQPQTDVFGLGAVLFWMLTGESPFERSERAATLAATLAGRAAFLAGARAEAPIELERLIGRALATAPQDRFRSMTEMAGALAVIERSCGRAPEDVLGGSVAPPPHPARPSAFRGLLPFTEADRERFFGRAHDVAALVEKLARPDCRFLALLGESGAGKSSLLRAGLLPALRELGHLAIYLDAYGEDPESDLLAELARQSLLAPTANGSCMDFLERVAEDLRTGIVLVLDQFESLLVESSRTEPRDRFLRALAEWHARSALPLRILASIRQDFVYRLIELEQAPEGWIPRPLAIDRVHTLRRLDRGQAEEVLERSFAAGGLAVPPALLRDLARELAADGDVLPLELQIVGSELERRSLFDRAAYRKAGGKAALVDGFLDEVIDGSGNARAAYRLLLSLVAEDGARRRLSRAEIDAEVRLTPASVDRLLERFVGARLIGVDQRGHPWRYELVHDQLAVRIQRRLGQLANARDRADRQLQQYLASYRLDSRTTIPLTALWSIRRYGSPPGDAGRKLCRRSLRLGIARATLMAAAVALATLVVAAPFSITRSWRGSVLRDGHRAAVRAAALSPDGHHLATAGEDGRLILWDLHKRLPAAEVADHGGWVHDVAFSPDGGSLASIGTDLRVAFRDPASLEPRHWIAAFPTDRPTRTSYSKLDFSPGGRYLAAWAPGVGSRVWESRGFRESTPIVDDHIGGSPLFSPDERWLLSPNGTTWDLGNGGRIADPFPEDLAGAYGSLSPDSSLLAAVSTLGLVTVWDVGRFWGGGPRSLVAKSRSHRDHGRSVAFSPDGELIASAAEDICLFEGRGSRLRARLPYAAITWDLVFSRDGRSLISTHGDGAVLIWDLAAQRPETRLGNHAAAVRAVAFSTDGRWLATASEDRSILIWDLDTRRLDAVLLAHETRINALSFSTGDSLYSADQLGDLVRWDLARRQPRWRASLRVGELDLANPLYTLGVSPDGRWAGTSRGVLDAATGELVVDFNGRPGLNSSNIYGLRFSPGGERLVVSMTSGSLHLLSVPDWRWLGSGSAGDVSLIALDISPGGRHLVTGEDEGVVRLWSIDPLEPIAVLGRHGSRVKAVAFSPAGDFIASAGDDRRLMLWDPAGRRPAREISTSATPVLSIAFSGDGALLASGSHDGSVRLFEHRGSLWGWPLP